MADYSCENIWNVADRGWDDLRDQIDGFLTSVLSQIAEAYRDSTANWLELNFWPDSGRLIAYPSTEGPFGDRDEKVFVQLFSDLLESEWQRCAQPGVADADNDGFLALSERVWGYVRQSLTSGNAGEALRSARVDHRLHVAAFNYEPGEGLFYLTEFDISATKEINRAFAIYKQKHGIGQ